MEILTSIYALGYSVTIGVIAVGGAVVHTVVNVAAAIIGQ
jgi:hypothetical protein